jgi:hypothetical protein
VAAATKAEAQPATHRANTVRELVMKDLEISLEATDQFDEAAPGLTVPALAPVPENDVEEGLVLPHDLVGLSNDELIAIANSRLLPCEAISNLVLAGVIKPEENFASYNLQALPPHGSRWEDNGSLQAGDTVDLFAAVFGKSRGGAAKIILDREIQDAFSYYPPIHERAPLPVEFPIESLPDPLRSMAKEISRIESVPVSLSATCVISAASGCMGKGIIIRTKPGKTTTPNLFILVAAESGGGKSSADTWAVAPIERFEKAAVKKFTQEAKTIKARLTLVERDIKALNQEKSGSEADREKQVTALAKAETEKEDLTAQLQPPCFIINNATSQALAVVMSHNNGTMMSRASDARGIVGIILGRHEKDKNQTDDELYLVAYSVTETYRTDRISRSLVMIPRPCLAIFWLIQPDMFGQLWDRKALKQGGFLPRFLTCRIVSEPQLVAREANTFSPEVATSYEARLTELLSTYLQHQGEAFTAQVTPEAKTVLFDYTDRIVERLCNDEFSAAEQPFAKRWAENAWRMSLVLHGAAHGDQTHLVPVSRETARAAVAVVSWFAVQQMEILGKQRSDQEGDKETKVMDLVRRHGRANIRSLKKAGICDDDAEASKLLGKLVRESMLEAYDQQGRGPSTRYYVLPKNTTQWS